MERFRTLKESGYATLLANNYPEQGRYAEALASTGAEPDARGYGHAARAARGRERTLAGRAAARPRPRPHPAGVTLADIDGDGDLDLVSVGPEGLSLRLNEGGRFVDATVARGLDAKLAGTGAIVADVDNDTKPDLLVLSAGDRAVAQRRGAFSDATTRPVSPARGRRPRPPSSTPTTTATSTSCWPGTGRSPIASSRTTGPRISRTSPPRPGSQPRRGRARHRAHGLRQPPRHRPARRRPPARRALPERPRRHVPRRGGARSACGAVAAGRRGVAAGDINKDDYHRLLLRVERRRRPVRAERRQGPLRRHRRSRGRARRAAGRCSSTTTTTGCWTS